jgi:hypothetical protein
MVIDGCTGFWWIDWIYPAATVCCNDHDMGGTDGQLLDCLLSVLPDWSGFLVVLAVLIMFAFRPIYHFIKRKMGLM